MQALASAHPSLPGQGSTRADLALVLCPLPTSAPPLARGHHQHHIVKVNVSIARGHHGVTMDNQDVTGVMWLLGAMPASLGVTLTSLRVTMVLLGIIPTSLGVTGRFQGVMPALLGVRLLSLGVASGC